VLLLVGFLHLKPTEPELQMLHRVFGGNGRGGRGFDSTPVAPGPFFLKLVPCPVFRRRCAATDKSALEEGDEYAERDEQAGDDGAHHRYQVLQITSSEKMSIILTSIIFTGRGRRIAGRVPDDGYETGNTKVREALPSETLSCTDDD